VRVIAGSAKGRRLEPVPGDTTRPITDRAKEALFSILGSELLGAAVLDLFAGTGSVGIEALSRGAAHCHFVEREPRAVATIRANLEKTTLAPRATVVSADVFAYLDRRPPAVPFDIVFIAPPQYQGLWSRALRPIDERAGWLAPTGVVVVQMHPKEYADLDLDTLSVSDRRRYGSVELVFYEQL
jgi:16S rRNA (guanine(966)-N(2))-methyltransferase RsmD